MSKEIPHYNPFGNNENNESNLNLTKEEEKKGFFNSVVKLLSSIKFWTILGPIVGVLSLVYIIWKDIDHRTEREKIVASINDLCSEIKDTFHPSSIVLDGDSLGDLHLIQDFQQTSREFVSLLESLESSFSSSYLSESNDRDDLVKLQEILNNCNKRNEDLNNYRINIITYLDKLMYIGSNNNIMEYSHFDQSKLAEAIKIWDEEGRELNQSFAKLKNKKGRTKLKKSIDLYESSYTSINFYKGNELLLKYIIDCNKFINNRLSKMKR